VQTFHFLKSRLKLAGVECAAFEDQRLFESHLNTVQATFDMVFY
jgi:hypothetical protein